MISEKLSAVAPLPVAQQKQDKKENVLPLRSVEERKCLKKHIPELLWMEQLARKFSDVIDVTIEDTIHWQEHDLPLYSLTLGNKTDNQVPTLLLTGGVHGVERIGTQVLLAWLQSVLERIRWDNDLKDKMQHMQIVMMPLVNPVGMFLNSRCNGNGVDLNRNSPIRADDKTPWLGGGHRYGGFLPWYRGREKDPMQTENQMLERVIRRQVFNHPLALVLDVHSGFGTRDRLWFPYAFRKKPIGNIANYFALKLLWERSYSNQPYIFEPQSLHYLTHGDLWDYFYLESKQTSGCNFLPLTLEMGSWAWVKKRPQQLLNFAGLFNPQKQHRHSRVLRRHIMLLDFLMSAALNSERWLPDDEQATLLKQAATTIWCT